MREEDYQVSFEIIATAGDSKGYSMDAICDAREGKFDSANEKINEANKRLLKAHELQTDMIAQEAGGGPGVEWSEGGSAAENQAAWR